MLKTPPGVSKRNVESGPLDEAGSVFETLYKKYLSLDADNLQKQAENYLLKSFCNKSNVKNNFSTQSSDFSEPRKSNSTQSSNSECVATTNDNFVKKTSFNLNNNSKYNNSTKKDYESDYKDYKENLKELNDDLKDLKKDLSNLKEDLQDSVQNLNQLQSNHPLTTLNNKFEKVNKQENFKEKVRFEDQTSPTDLSPKFNKHSKFSYKDLTKKLKKPVKQSTKEDTRIYIDSSSDISVDSVENKQKGKNLITVEEFYDDNFDKVDEYLSPTSLGRRKSESRNNLAAKNKELNFICTVCMLIQILLTLVLFGFFFLFYSFPYENNYWFVNVLFPFVVHFGSFYLVFTFTDYTLKKRYLVYTNDYTVDILSKRLNRELCYTKLSKYSTWGERALVLLGLCISCIPVAFTSDFKAFSPKEYLYLALVAGYLVLHVGFTYYYFNVKFKGLLVHTNSDDS